MNLSMETLKMCQKNFPSNFVYICCILQTPYRFDEIFCVKKIRQTVNVNIRVTPYRFDMIFFLSKKFRQTLFTFLDSAETPYHFDEIFFLPV